ncbi:fibronectin type III domain-containing protein [Pedobacter boryungensis]|uniref:Fibronectin type III domain-containing protein n=1 Tax=Pedobacter boryungensis TaxID=869962 RepID=A0ABX2DB78_9SPHI|nr:fibronectin type III domain-containing protein [Pedobacter boryungensis]NQX31310.1 fibronectin type III domain-containing protein [Pedobacter boryungensis]
MSKPKIVTTFTRYRDSELSAKANFIIKSMTSNANFASPVPSLGEITAADNDYTAALSDAETGGKSAIAVKNQAREKLEALLIKLSHYVTIYGNEDEVVLLSSGFSLAKGINAVGILPKPTGFSVKATEKGMATIKLDKINGAGVYQFEYRTVGTEVWTTFLSTKSMVLLQPLTSGLEYEFRVTAAGSAEERIYSDVLKSFIL